jgi:hypothetical protein
VEFTYTIDSPSSYNTDSIRPNPGVLTVTPVTTEVVVTVEGRSDSAVYNGQPHSVNGYDITSISNTLYTEAMFDKPAQDAAVATATRSTTGTTTMTLSATDFANTSANFSNVRFDVTPGEITVIDTARPTFTVPNDTAVCRVSGELVASVSVTGDVTDEADNCSTVLEATWNDLDTLSADNSGNRIICREWTLIDDHGNTTTKIQNITVRPSILTLGNAEFYCPDTTVTLKYGACDTVIELRHTLINNMSGMTVVLDSIGIPYNNRYSVDHSLQSNIGENLWAKMNVAKPY